MIFPEALARGLKIAGSDSKPTKQNYASRSRFGNYQVKQISELLSFLLWNSSNGELSHNPNQHFHEKTE
jgi:hypothetical protein